MSIATSMPHHKVRKHQSTCMPEYCRISQYSKVDLHMSPPLHLSLCLRL